MGLVGRLMVAGSRLMAAWLRWLGVEACEARLERSRLVVGARVKVTVAGLVPKGLPAAAGSVGAEGLLWNCAAVSAASAGNVAAGAAAAAAAAPVLPPIMGLNVASANSSNGCFCCCCCCCHVLLLQYTEPIMKESRSAVATSSPSSPVAVSRLAAAAASAAAAAVAAPQGDSMLVRSSGSDWAFCAQLSGGEENCWSGIRMASCCVVPWPLPRPLLSAALPPRPAPTRPDLLLLPRHESVPGPGSSGRALGDGNATLPGMRAKPPPLLQVCSTSPDSAKFPDRDTASAELAQLLRCAGLSTAGSSDAACDSECCHGCSCSCCSCLCDRCWLRISVLAALPRAEGPLSGIRPVPVSGLCGEQADWWKVLAREEADSERWPGATNVPWEPKRVAS